MAVHELVDALDRMIAPDAETAEMRSRIRKVLVFLCRPMPVLADGERCVLCGVPKHRVVMDHGRPEVAAAVIRRSAGRWELDTPTVDTTMVQVNREMLTRLTEAANT